MEQLMQSPYTKNRDHPYHLHGIMIHQGSASGGHYWSYVYDRVQKVWWELNDHRARTVKEEDVFKMSYGNPKTPSSAYLLIYISSNLANKMDRLRLPLYAFENANNYQIPSTVLGRVEEDNKNFKMEY